MTAPRDPKSGVHPLARPLSGLSSPRAGLITLIVLAVLVVAGFALETVIHDGGLSKYPEVYGPYELLPLARRRSRSCWAGAWSGWSAVRAISMPAPLAM